MQGILVACKATVWGVVVRWYEVIWWHCRIVVGRRGGWVAVTSMLLPLGEGVRLVCYDCGMVECLQVWQCGRIIVQVSSRNRHVAPIEEGGQRPTTAHSNSTTTHPPMHCLLFTTFSLDNFLRVHLNYIEFWIITFCFFSSDVHLLSSLRSANNTLPDTWDFRGCCHSKRGGLVLSPPAPYEG